MAAYFEHSKIEGTKLAERKTGDAAVGFFLDGFGDLAVLAAVAVPPGDCEERTTRIRY